MYIASNVISELDNNHIIDKLFRSGSIISQCKTGSDEITEEYSVKGFFVVQVGRFVNKQKKRKTT